MLGMIFLLYFMGKKEATFNYSPNKRVLADINKKDWLFDSNIDTLEISRITFTDKFKVDFSKSDVELDSCKTYVLVHKTEKKDFFYKIENCSKKAKFKKILF
tara:strand:- start:330 stop:635 length:306 start_codon:yes stop_codon:yes gene_type:complete